MKSNHMNSNIKEYEDRILKLLQTRGPDKTICPSEILATPDKQNKEMMEEVRTAAKNLVSQNKIVITQKGEVINSPTIKGPIRLKLKKNTE